MAAGAEHSATVKSEIPSPAAVVTAFEAKVAIPENAKPGII